MLAMNPVRTFDERTKKAAEKVKQKAKARKAQVMTAPVVCRDVDRTRLASILAPLGYTVEADRLVMPTDLARLDVLATQTLASDAPFSAYFQGARVQPDEDENAALRRQHELGTAYGPVELWGVRRRKGEGEDTHFFWAQASAVAVQYPDAYTRERRGAAGVRSLSGVGAPLLVERYGLQRRS